MDIEADKDKHTIGGVNYLQWMNGCMELLDAIEMVASDRDLTLKQIKKRVLELTHKRFEIAEKAGVKITFHETAGPH